jgi:hypothetical protein
MVVGGDSSTPAIPNVLQKRRVMDLRADKRDPNKKLRRHSRWIQTSRKKYVERQPRWIKKLSSKKISIPHGKKETSCNIAGAILSETSGAVFGGFIWLGLYIHSCLRFRTLHYTKLWLDHTDGHSCEPSKWWYEGHSHKSHVFNTSVGFVS